MMVQGRGAGWETGNISAVDISRAPSQARCGKTQGRIEDNSESHSGKSRERRAQGSRRSAHNSIMDELRKLELVSCECVCDGRGKSCTKLALFCPKFLTCSLHASVLAASAMHHTSQHTRAHVQKHQQESKTNEFRVCRIS